MMYTVWEMEYSFHPNMTPDDFIDFNDIKEWANLTNVWHLMLLCYSAWLYENFYIEEPRWVDLGQTTLKEFQNELHWAN